MPVLKLTVPLLAAEVHLVLGMLFVMGAVALGFPAWYGLAAIVALETPKELIFDPVTEGTPNGLTAKLWEGARDFAWWIIGSGVAVGILMLAAFFHL